MKVDNPTVWLSATLVVVMVVVGQIVYSGYKVRSRVNHLRKMGLPMPPWNWLTGHLPFLRATLSKYPSNILFSVVIKDIALTHFPSSEMFYLDLWPFAAPTLVVCNVAASSEVNRKLNTKPEVYKTLFDPMSGGPSLLSMNGREWKYWRGLLNPGFAPGYLMNRVGDMVESVERFCEILERKAEEKNVFQLENVAMRLTLESIIKIASDEDLNYQRKDHPVPEAFQNILPWTSTGTNPLDKFHPLRRYMLAYYDRIIDDHFAQGLKKGYAEYTSNPSQASPSIISLTIASHINYQQRWQQDNDKTLKKQDNGLDENFLKCAIHQLRMLLVAGHDTTASVLVYIYHMLYKNPRALSLLREEHTRVFGSNPKDASSLLRDKKKSAKLLNNIPYTVAVIKETLRLFPPGGAFRSGSPDVVLTGKDGTVYPTEGCLVSLAHHAIHYNPNTYYEPDAFRPERWLDSSSSKAGAEKGAFRPFERGPRNCIGQDIANLEMKVALVLTARRFRIRPAYEEWDALESEKEKEKEKKNERGILSKIFGSSGRWVKRDVDGERAYQVEEGGAHPAEAYPCRVEVVEE